MRYNRAAAVAHLCGHCQPLKRFISQTGAYKLKVYRDTDVFNALSRAIVYQQLSGKAAGTIHGRFLALFDNEVARAAQVENIGYDALRGAGLSNNKALSVIDLAQRAMDGRLASYRGLSRLDDSEVTENLCAVRGIGPWTAQMFLMFNLGRPDVMPATDLGVQKGVQAVYRLQQLPTEDEVHEYTGHLAPYRSAASWYFWRAADTVLMT